MYVRMCRRRGHSVCKRVPVFCGACLCIHTYVHTYIHTCIVRTYVCTYVYAVCDTSIHTYVAGGEFLLLEIGRKMH